VTRNANTPCTTSSKPPCAPRGSTSASSFNILKKKTRHVSPTPSHPSGPSKSAPSVCLTLRLPALVGRVILRRPCDRYVLPSFTPSLPPSYKESHVSLTPPSLPSLTWDKQYVLQLDSHMRFRPGWDLPFLLTPPSLPPSPPLPHRTSNTSSNSIVTCAFGRAGTSISFKPSFVVPLLLGPSSPPTPSGTPFLQSVPLTPGPPSFVPRASILEVRTFRYFPSFLELIYCREVNSHLSLPPPFPPLSQGMLRQTARRCKQANLEQPLPSKLWASGFNFAPAAAWEEVPYDPHLRHLFFGEEVSMAARLWTWGWDFFAPPETVLYHLWSRSHRPSFREVKVEEEGGKEEGQARSVRRVRMLLGVGSEEEREEGREEGWGRYGLGKVRTLREYERLLGVSFATASVTSSNAQWGGQPSDFFEGGIGGMVGEGNSEGGGGEEQQQEKQSAVVEGVLGVSSLHALVNSFLS